jgi:hypothetical protein
MGEGYFVPTSQANEEIGWHVRKFGVALVMFH